MNARSGFRSTQRQRRRCRLRPRARPAGTAARFNQWGVNLTDINDIAEELAAAGLRGGLKKREAGKVRWKDGRGELFGAKLRAGAAATCGSDAEQARSLPFRDSGRGLRAVVELALPHPRFRVARRLRWMLMNGSFMAVFHRNPRCDSARCSIVAAGDSGHRQDAVRHDLRRGR